MKPTSHFGPWLQSCRKTYLSLTQEELAERIGCSRDMIHKIETGSRSPSRKLAVQLAEQIQVPAEQQHTFVQFARGRLQPRHDSAAWPAPPSLPELVDSQQECVDSAPPPVQSAASPATSTSGTPSPVDAPTSAKPPLRWHIPIVWVSVTLGILVAVMILIRYGNPRLLATAERGTISSGTTAPAASPAALLDSHLSVSTQVLSNMVQVEEGAFLWGSTPEDIERFMELCHTFNSGCVEGNFDDEMPQRTVFLSTFWIDTHEVTNAHFQAFVADTGYTTTAEQTGVSEVLRDMRPNAGTDTVQGATWQHPEGPGSAIHTRMQYECDQNL